MSPRERFSHHGAVDLRARNLARPRVRVQVECSSQLLVLRHGTLCRMDEAVRQKSFTELGEYGNFLRLALYPYILLSVLPVKRSLRFVATAVGLSCDPWIRQPDSASSVASMSLIAALICGPSWTSPYQPGKL